MYRTRPISFEQQSKKSRKQKKHSQSSPAGNRTLVFRVTGGDTHHYTTEDTAVKQFKKIIIQCLKLQLICECSCILSFLRLSRLFSSVFLLRLIPLPFFLIKKYGFSHSVNHCTIHSVSHSVNHSVNRSFHHSFNHSCIHLFIQSVSQSVI